MCHLDKMSVVLILLDSLDRNWSAHVQKERDWNLWVTTLGSTQKHPPGGVGILYLSITTMATVFPIPPSHQIGGISARRGLWVEGGTKYPRRTGCQSARQNTSAWFRWTWILTTPREAPCIPIHPGVPLQLSTKCGRHVALALLPAVSRSGLPSRDIPRIKVRIE